MEPNIKLSSADGQCFVFACSGCKMVVPCEEYRCHCRPRPCEVCGENIAARSYCRTCVATRQQETERKRFEKANKVPAAKYPGWVYCERTDEWFESADEAVADLKDRSIDLPEYLWGSTENRIHFDADSLVSCALEDGNAYEDASADAGGIKDLQAFLDAWCEKHSPVWYLQDYKTAVIL